MGEEEDMTKPADSVLRLELTYNADEGVVLARATTRPGVREVAILTGDDSAADSDAMGRAFAAAPDLARELLHLVQLLELKEREGGLDVSELATLNGARAALKKADVL